MALIDDETEHETWTRFTLEEVRAWQSVLAALDVERIGLWMALAIAGLSAAVAIAFDRSERAVALPIFGGGQLVLAVMCFSSLIMCCWAPAPSYTRRQARRITLMVAVAILVLGLLIAGIEVEQRFPRNLPRFDFVPLPSLILVIAFLSWAVHVAFTVWMWLALHAAIARDLRERSLEGRVAPLQIAWIVTCALSGLLIVLSIFAAPRATDGALVVLGKAAIALSVLEVIHLRLVNRCRSAIRTCVGEPLTRDVAFNRPMHTGNDPHIG